MSTVQPTSNKATFRRFLDAMNTGDAELISKTIDDLVEPDVLIRTPLPVEATGAQALKEVFGRLHRAFPDLHVTAVPGASARWAGRDASAQSDGNVDAKSIHAHDDPVADAAACGGHVPQR